MMNAVMVVDDSDSDLLFARILLERTGITAQVLCFESAAEALQVLRSAAPGDIDLVLLDINMPGMDGFQFLAGYQDQPGRCRAPVLMVSSSPDPEDRRRAAAFACVKGYLVKPLEIPTVADLPRLLGH